MRRILRLTNQEPGEYKRILPDKERVLYHLKDGVRIEGPTEGLLEGPNNMIFGDCTGLKNGDYIAGNITGLYGDARNLSGDVTFLTGDCTGLEGVADEVEGNLDKCELTSENRTNVAIDDLVGED
jgi:hypothetical protein